VTDVYEFIDSCRDANAKYAYPVKKMCLCSAVSSSGFFAWASRPQSATAARRTHLATLVVAIFDVSDQTYGYRRVHAQLARQGEQCGPELVRQIMRDAGLITCQPRPWRHSLTEADGREHHIPDLLEQDFTADAPGTTLIGDITYIPTWQGWLYLATVIDVHTRMVIGYATGDNYRTPLISAALRAATINQKIAPNAIFHSDRGSNYTSTEFATTISALGMRQSMGRTGICYDNAMAESFFAALKNERINRTAYPTREHARKDITRYIEFWYNTKRLHSSLGYTTPEETLNEWTDAQTAA